MNIFLYSCVFLVYSCCLIYQHFELQHLWNNLRNLYFLQNNIFIKQLKEHKLKDLIHILYMIFGLSGFKSSGKDTVADYLVSNYDFVKLSFASTLKDVVSILFSWPRDKLEGITTEDRQWREQVDPFWSQKLNIPQLTPRYVLQYIGTDLLRQHFHPDIWLIIIEHKINIYLSSCPSINIVVTDCRFQNEIDMIKKLGGKMIHIHRNSTSLESSTHPSETEWMSCEFDHHISNNETILSLYHNINILFKKQLKDNN